MFEIGNSLREARVRKGLDFPALEQSTKIRAKYLRALEDEQFDQLPASTYVKGFLRAYAEQLGLDGQLYVDEYNSRYASGEELLERHVRRRSTARPRPRQRRLESHVVWLALVGIALVTALVIAAWRYGGGGDGQSLPLNAKPATSSTRSRPAAGLFVRAVGGSSLLIVRKGSESGKLLFQGTLERGNALRFPSGRLWLNLGTPENLTMRLNGRPVLVGGEKPRSLIVTAGNDIVPAGPGT